MNAAQGVSCTAGELEKAMAMVTRAKAGRPMDWQTPEQERAAVVPDASAATVHACAWRSFFAGGAEAHLLTFLGIIGHAGVLVAKKGPKP